MKWHQDFFFICHIYPPFMRKRCIAMFWTVSPHSLGSCHFRVTCLPHKGGGVPLSALPKDTTSELAGLFSTISHKCRAPSREAVDTIFKVFSYDSTRGMNPRSTDCEAKALTTTPSRKTWNKALHIKIPQVPVYSNEKFFFVKPGLQR